MTAVDLIARFLTAYKFSLPLDQVCEEAHFPDLERLGFAQYRQAGAEIICDACDTMHPVMVAIDPVANKLGWRCPSVGFVEADAEILRSVRLNVEALAVRMSDALGCQRRRERPLIANVLWNIGSFELQKNDVNVYLARRIADTDDMAEIASALQAEPALRNGLVILPDHRGAPGLTIAGCRLAALWEVIEISSDGLLCDQDRVARLAGIDVSRRTGRPVHDRENEAYELVRIRISRGESAGSKRAEAREVIRLMGDGAPGQTKLFEIISDVWSVR